MWFLAQLQSDETPPKNPADGIVVLTGGSSRVADAVDLLASGYGKRLLISGVHWSNSAGEISRSLRDNKSWLACCVDLDYSAVDTRGNAAETRRWAQERGFRSLIVVTSNYHMPRAIVEFSHSMPDVLLIPFPVIGEKWRDEPWWASGAGGATAGDRIREVPCRRRPRAYRRLGLTRACGRSSRSRCRASAPPARN